MRAQLGVFCGVNLALRALTSDFSRRHLNDPCEILIERLLDEVDVVLVGLKLARAKREDVKIFRGLMLTDLTLSRPCEPAKSISKCSVLPANAPFFIVFIRDNEHRGQKRGEAFPDLRGLPFHRILMQN